MQRSEALAPLSRQHHVALEVALRLRRATAEDADAARAAFLAFFEDELREHLRAEEDLLLPAFSRHVAGDDPDVVRVLVEHVELRRRAQDAAAGPGALADLHELGDLLNDHVRHEERTLFPRVEAALEPAELERLGTALSAQGAAHRPPRV
ncbi:MAG: hemerythrin domain-containing protein [Solirubrobacteraceae bacterium]|nr:hemerythrin domain-containing protein [Solirubrobacteraceae bacterium]